MSDEESYTYAKAGVDIAAGNALVKAIGPLAKATARPGAHAALGGLGGFFLPSMPGAVRDVAGTYAPGLLLLAAAFFAGAIGLLHLGSVWNARWRTDAVKQSGIFCYRDVVREWRGQQAA